MKITLFPTLLLSFFSLLYVLMGINNSSLTVISILPLLLLILTLIFNELYLNYANSVVFKLLILQLNIRYSILPTLLSTNPTFQNNTNFNISIIIMILELFFCFIVLFLLQGKQKTAFINRSLYTEPLKSLPLIIIFLISLLLYIYSTGTFNIINPVWSFDNYIDTYITKNKELIVSAYGSILFTIFRSLLALVAISITFRSKYIKQRHKKWLYLIMIIFSNLYIIDTSRFSIILFSLPLIVVINSLLNKEDSRKVISIAIITILIVLSTVSLAKFSRYGNTADFSNVLSVSSINAYFSGPLLISIGLEAGSNIRIYDSIQFLFNDTLSNIPLISKFTIDEFKTAVIFNEEIYGHREYRDQIVPQSINGYFHFGILGVIFYSSLFLSLALWFERAAYRESHLGFRYVYTVISISLSLVFMVNISSMYANIARNYLFLFIPLILINYVSKILINKKY